MTEANRAPAEQNGDGLLFAYHVDPEGPPRALSRLD